MDMMCTKCKKETNVITWWPNCSQCEIKEWKEKGIL